MKFSKRLVQGIGLMAFALTTLGCARERLIWSDEFDVAGVPDNQLWSYEHGFVRNREMQWYQAANATVTNGCLVITGKQETRDNPWYRKPEIGKDKATQDNPWYGDTKYPSWAVSRPTIEYTSACLHSKRSFLYGRMEIRAKIQAEEGLWPAIWFMGVERPWPLCGEVDLLEYYQESILANFCWSAGTPKRPVDSAWNTKKIPITEFLAKDEQWRTAWHVWELVWTPEKMELKLDGETLNSQKIADSANPDHTLPFTQPMYLLLNLAMGSTGGSLEKTRLPAHFIIDYVRLYQ